MPKAEGATVTTKVLYTASALAAAAIPTTYQQNAAIDPPQAHPGRNYESAQGTESVMAYDERLIDAKLDAVEARTETKFAQLLGKLELVSVSIGDLAGKIGELDQKIGTVDSHTRSAKSAIVGTIIGTGIAVAALAWGAVQIYQGGMGTSTAAFQSGMAVAEQKADNDTKGSDRAK